MKAIQADDGAEQQQYVPEIGNEDDVNAGMENSGKKRNEPGRRTTNVTCTPLIMQRLGIVAINPCLMYSVFPCR